MREQKRNTPNSGRGDWQQVSTKNGRELEKGSVRTAEAICPADKYEVRGKDAKAGPVKKLKHAHCDLLPEKPDNPRIGNSYVDPDTGDVLNFTQAISTTAQDPLAALELHGLAEEDVASKLHKKDHTEFRLKEPFWMNVNKSMGAELDISIENKVTGRSFLLECKFQDLAGTAHQRSIEDAAFALDRQEEEGLDYVPLLIVYGGNLPFCGPRVSELEKALKAIHFPMENVVYIRETYSDLVRALNEVVKPAIKQSYI